ncbi:MAG: hypothetical protein RLZZ350_923, partial [Verrucomicrobiota bacterium]
MPSTPQQIAAITARGNVLVAAGAGTGKTSTVVARCLQLVMEENCSLGEILMVTFTEAAAAEMRARIRESLSEKIAAEPSVADRLAEELTLLDHAPISTLHGFCLELVRRHFHTLGLDPQFSVLDEQQSKPLLHATLDELFQRHYAGETPLSASVCDLIRNYGDGRDEKIRDLVWKIHQHSQTLPSPERWLQSQLAAFENPAPENWRALFTAAVRDWAQLWLATLAPVACEHPNLTAAHAALSELGDDFQSTATALEKITAAEAADWKRKKTQFHKPYEAFFDDARFLATFAQTDGLALAEDWNWTRQPMLALLRLAQEFTHDFSRAKRELGGIDFADQEQFALRLLLGDDDQPTLVALACRERFRFVFVDECQDINAAQDAILRAVSRSAPVPGAATSSISTAHVSPTRSSSPGAAAPET